MDRNSGSSAFSTHQDRTKRPMGTLSVQDVETPAISRAPMTHNFSGPGNFNQPGSADGQNKSNEPNDHTFLTQRERSLYASRFANARAGQPDYAETVHEHIQNGYDSPSLSGAGSVSSRNQTSRVRHLSPFNLATPIPPPLLGQRFQTPALNLPGSFGLDPNIPPQPPAAPSSSLRSAQPSVNSSAPGRKEYCTYWLRKGECDYMQQGCNFLHEMPTDKDTLLRLGFRDIPSWYRELHGLSSLQNINNNNPRQHLPPPPPQHHNPHNAPSSTKPPSTRGGGSSSSTPHKPSLHNPSWRSNPPPRAPTKDASTQTDTPPCCPHCTTHPPPPSTASPPLIIDLLSGLSSLGVSGDDEEENEAAEQQRLARLQREDREHCKEMTRAWQSPLVVAKQEASASASAEDGNTGSGTAAAAAATKAGGSSANESSGSSGSAAPVRGRHGSSRAGGRGKGKGKGRGRGRKGGRGGGKVGGGGDDDGDREKKVEEDLIET
ncbi:MAG: hypothetical protein Q9227_003377 [Pyrenula ochraceoflavens]